MPTPVTAIFDIGKTNKKFFLFDENLNEIKEEYFKLPLIEDDDGFACDDLSAITQWIKSSVESICKSPHYRLVGLNFSTYGATLVHLDEKGNPTTPLYNYLKPFPSTLLQSFFSQYDEETNNLETASPNLGMLNAGLQLYWLRHEKPQLFKKIRYTLHFPQYLSYLFTGEMVCEPTSIGCHTRLWDYERNNYHYWVMMENFDALFPQFVPTTHTFTRNLYGQEVRIGVGIHDSSSALAAYLLRSKDPFLLISTGTWSIVLNPFTTESLTQHALDRDCLNYLTIHGSPVRAARFFLGFELDHQLEKLTTLFNKDRRYYKTLEPDLVLIEKLAKGEVASTYYPETIQNQALLDDLFPKGQWNPKHCENFEEAYHKMVWGLAKMQSRSLALAQGSTFIKRVYIDGGFIHNKVFRAMLRYLLKDHELIFSDLPLGSAYGAACVLKHAIAYKRLVKG